jgi:hypothetical protein
MKLRYLLRNIKPMNIEEELTAIKERNWRVEADKAWETSGMRIFSIMIITYMIAALVLYFIGASNWPLGALVPTAGYFLSTQSLPAIKRWWVEKFFRK